MGKKLYTRVYFNDVTVHKHFIISCDICTYFSAAGKSRNNETFLPYFLYTYFSVYGDKDLGDIKK